MSLRRNNVEKASGQGDDSSSNGESASSEAITQPVPVLSEEDEEKVRDWLRGK